MHNVVNVVTNNPQRFHLTQCIFNLEQKIHQERVEASKRRRGSKRRKKKEKKKEEKKEKKKEEKKEEKRECVFSIEQRQQNLQHIFYKAKGREY